MPDMKFCPLCGKDLIVKEIEGKDYKACPADSCQYVFWNNPVPVVAAIVEHHGNVVLARNKAWPENMFGLITGFLEKDETPESAVIREVEEELGLKGKIESLVGIYSFFRMNQLILAYHISAKGNIKLGVELAEVKPVPPEEIRPWPFGTGFALKDWLESRGIKPE